jgi:hypothetical protein
VALSSLRADQQNASAFVRKFRVADAQRQRFRRPQRRESDGRKESSQHGSTLGLFGNPVQHRRTLLIVIGTSGYWTLRNADH